MTVQTASQVILGGVDHTGITGRELRRVIIGGNAVTSHLVAETTGWEDVLNGARGFAVGEA